MDLNAVAQLAAQFGASGVLVGYLIWRDTRHDKWRQTHEQDKAATEQKHREERLAADRERTAEIRAETSSREKLAGALSALATFITGRPHV